MAVHPARPQDRRCRRQRDGQLRPGDQHLLVRRLSNHSIPSLRNSERIHMATDAFIQIQGCEGESTDKNHSNWTEIQDWTWGVEQPTTGTASTGGARTSGRLTNEPFVFTAMIDAAYPKLLTNCCKGT